ncbi:unannotated protein [freshwater metagenome]|uniref:Unannotated protein n=1 Tax=freshwater metagenome TaxID=449393 RepID=A0A6J6XA69_9ZZZZ
MTTLPTLFSCSQSAAGPRPLVALALIPLRLSPCTPPSLPPPPWYRWPLHCRRVSVGFEAESATKQRGQSRSSCLRLVRSRCGGEHRSDGANGRLSPSICSGPFSTSRSSLSELSNCWPDQSTASDGQRSSRCLARSAQALSLLRPLLGSSIPRYFRRAKKFSAPVRELPLLSVPVLPRWSSSAEQSGARGDCFGCGALAQIPALAEPAHLHRDV